MHINKILMNQTLKRKVKGSLTVEATLVLPIVIITLLFIANILNICMVHLCMQQALNNVAKKTSQNSYIIYRFLGEEDYSSFINSLNSLSSDKSSDGILPVTKFNDAQNSTKATIKVFEKATHSFDGMALGNFIEKISTFIKNIKDLIDNLKATKGVYEELAKSINDLVAHGKDDFQSAIISIMLDSGSNSRISSAFEYLFNNYKNELGVPASKIEELQFYPTKYDATNSGTYKMLISYYYKNPFSFVNQKSLEYSVINKKIKMVNVITVRPFIGRTDSTFMNIPSTDDVSVEEGGGGSASLTGGAGHSGGGSGGGGR